MNSHKIRSAGRLLSVLIAGVLVSACEQSVAPTETARSAELNRSARSVPLIQSPIRTLDDEFVSIAIPGFGGAFEDPNTGEFYAYSSSEPALDAGIRNSARAFFLAGGVNVPAVTVLRGDYSFRELFQWRSEIEGRLLSRIVLSDVDEANNRVLIGVADQTRVREVWQVVDVLGIDRAAVAVEVFSDLNPLAGAPRTDAAAQVLTLQSQIRPVVAGSRIWISAPGSGAPCSLGGVVVREWPFGTYDVTGDRYLMTNAHCTPSFGSVTAGTVMGQPNSFNPIGVEFSDPPLKAYPDVSACPQGAGAVCRWSDAALFSLNAGVTSAFDSVPNLSGSTYLGNLPMGGSMTGWWFGMAVEKIGSTTNSTSGTITNTCINYYISGRILVCQVAASYSSATGDSGAPVYTSYGGASDLAFGITHAGGGSGSIFSNLVYARSELAADMRILTGLHFWPAVTDGPTYP